MLTPPELSCTLMYRPDEGLRKRKTPGDHRFVLISMRTCIGTKGELRCAIYCHELRPQLICQTVVEAELDTADPLYRLQAGGGIIRLSKGKQV